MAGTKYEPTLTVTPFELRSGDYFDVHGEGFDQQYGNVVIGFTGGSWGSPIADDGTFSIPGIPALSGDTLPADEYPVTAYQYVNGKKMREVAEATLTVVE